MKKIISISLVCLLITGLLTGCGKSLEADRDTVYVQKKGTIISAAIADFDKDYYQEEELKNYVDDRIQAYQSTHGQKSIQIDDFSVEEGIAKLFIKYAGYEDYQEFNDVTLFSGTVPQALAAGYKFDTEFSEIVDEKVTGNIENTKIMELDAKIIILSEKVDVKVDGTVQYVSSKYTTIKAEDTVSIQLTEDAEDGEESTLVYIIYQ
ncbi:MAG: hypothetical protein K1V96_10940 [Lachnospiraceae bacterium]